MLFGKQKFIRGSKWVWRKAGWRPKKVSERISMPDLNFIIVKIAVQIFLLIPKHNGLFF
jgi:hypothetical protein